MAKSNADYCKTYRQRQKKERDNILARLEKLEAILSTDKSDSVDRLSDSVDRFTPKESDSVESVDRFKEKSDSVDRFQRQIFSPEIYDPNTLSPKPDQNLSTDFSGSKIDSKNYLPTTSDKPNPEGLDAVAIFRGILVQVPKDNGDYYSWQKRKMIITRLLPTTLKKYGVTWEQRLTQEIESVFIADNTKPKIKAMIIKEIKEAEAIFGPTIEVQDPGDFTGDEDEAATEARLDEVTEMMLAESLVDRYLKERNFTRQTFGDIQKIKEMDAKALRLFREYKRNRHG